MIPFNPAHPISLKEVIKTDTKIQNLMSNDLLIQKLFRISIELEGLLRHASTHAAGVVISDKPLVNLLPLYSDSKSSFPATQFSMKYVEKAGLVKFDFLGLKTLTVIAKTIQLLNERGENLDLSTLPLNDSKTFELIRTGETIGVFQFDGKGMRETITQIKPDRFEDLIAIVSLYRPGPMDNIPLYVKRKNSNEKIDFIHEDLKEILSETYGIMVYQEQVMQIAQKLAGFSLAKADLLRRAMGKKIKSEMFAQKKNFVTGCKENKINEIKAEKLFLEVEKFAGYGFNKSHAAAYALVSYQTAYLKAHYPLEFFCASMECDINNIEKLNVFSKEIKRLGFEIFKPNINQSFETFKVRYNSNKALGIDYALGAIKNIGENSIKQLIKERENNGKFKSLIDLLERVDNSVLNKRQLENLIYSDSLSPLEKNQNFLDKNIEKIIKFNVDKHKSVNKFQENLFDQNILDNDQFNSSNFLSWDLVTRLRKEMESVGFYLSEHPIIYYQDIFSNSSFKKLNYHSIKNVESEKIKTNFNSLVIINSFIEKKSRNGNKFAFMGISDETLELEVICFSDLIQRLEHLPKVGDLCLVNLELSKSNDSIRYICSSIQIIDVSKEIKNQKFLIEINMLIFDFEKFSKLINNNKGGENYLNFIVKKNEYRYKLESKEKFFVDLNFINTLKKVNGIENIERVN